MSLYDAVRDLPLIVDDYALDGLEQQVSSGFLRKSTVIRLAGAGEEGLGEDVTYEATEHDLVQAQGPVHPLAGEWTIATFSDHLATLALFDHEPDQHAYLDYRRWAYESAALDLALRQAGLSLGDAVGRSARPLTFVVSMRLGEPATTERLRAWLELYPSLRFKLDATPDWTERADRRARADRARSTPSTSRASTTERASTRCPTPSSTSGSSPASPTPGSRIPR